MRFRIMAITTMAALVAGGCSASPHPDIRPRPTASPQTARDTCPLPHGNSVRDFLAVGCHTFWGNPTEVFSVDMRGQWHATYSALVSKRQTDPWLIKFSYRDKTVTATLPPLSRSRDRPFNLTLDHPEYLADAKGAVPWPLFTRINYFAEDFELRANVRPAPGAQLDDYVYLQTVGQLDAGHSGYITAGDIRRATTGKAVSGQPKPQFIPVITQDTMYQTTRTSATPVRVTRTGNRFTVCLPSGTTVPDDHEVGGADLPWNIPVKLVC